MPRPKKPGVEPKRRSRNGCWPCKARKVKCGEEKPRCVNCERQGETCDYSIRLNWGGRMKRTSEKSASGPSSTSGSPHMSTISFDDDVSPLFTPVTPDASFPRSNMTTHTRSRSGNSLPTSQPSPFEAEMEGLQHTPPQSHAMMATAGPFEQNQSFSQSMPQLDSNKQQFESRIQTQFRAPFDYPSPSGSNFDAFNYTTGANFSSMNAQAPLSPPMPPPVRADVMYKRHKSTYSVESPATTSSVSNSETYSPNPGPYSPFMGMPLTPNSSISSEEPIVRTAPKSTGSAYAPPDLRRLSVQSLLAGPPGESSQAYSPDAQHSRQYPIDDAAATTYGYDLGHPDLDSPRNEDHSAIAVYSPPSGMMALDNETTYGNAEPRGKDMAFEKGGYYAKPVPIRISKSLEPLPPILMENPMNLLYFHHFLNHTARILVPHDCEKNPFRQILPEMAVRDDNIMNLLLAYSASHRARMLNHEEPVNRIAVWVKDVFPKLRESLANPHQISNTALAPAIMMASLEIISPNTFEVPISWQSHLTMARQMIIARGGPRTMDRHDRVAYFLSRWFAYLDVLGSLSGNKNDQPLGSFYWSSENASADEDFEIDCLMGFTNRCVGSLASIAELAKQCEPQRIDAEGNIREDWRPAPEVVRQAIAIRRELEEGLSDQYIHKGCNHRSSDSSESEGAWDATEIYATNEMFHWAGLIHLYRRVLGKTADDAEVQHAVREIVGLLYKVRRGSTAEACLLFPMFAAGCDALNQGQREKIMERLRCVEGFGMTQVHKARALMQKVWDTGKPWESLVSGEFFG